MAISQYSQYKSEYYDKYGGVELTSPICIYDKIHQ